MILGHENVMRSVAATLASGRLAHAYRLNGPAGVGKKRIALALARAVLCPARGEAAAFGCGRCESCRAVDTFRHPDLLVYHDFDAPRWMEVEEKDEGLRQAIAALRETPFVKEPAPRAARRHWEMFRLDHTLAFKGTVWNPGDLADRIARLADRGGIPPEVRDLVAELYYQRLSLLPYRATLGIHLVARREGQTPERGSLRDHLARTALWGGAKVVVVDDAHRMTEEAQNALLKTLEEPPRGSHILLVTDDPGSLLPTVRSRTPEIACGRLPLEVVAAALRRQQMDAAAAGWLAGWSEGSLGRALEAEQDDIAARRALVRLLDSAVRARDHLAAFGLLAQLTLEHEAQGDRVRRLRGMQQHLEILMLWYRDLAVAAQLGERAPLLNADWRADILKSSRTLAPETCRAMFKVVASQAALLGPSSELRLSGEEMLVSLFDAHR